MVATGANDVACMRYRLQSLPRMYNYRSGNGGHRRQRCSPYVLTIAIVPAWMESPHSPLLYDGNPR